MMKRSWLYGLIVFLAQTCNPYYSADESRYESETMVVAEVEQPNDIIDMDLEMEIIAPPPPPPLPPIYSDEYVEEVEMEEEEIFQVVEELPRFIGCENMGLEKRELDQCARRKMMQFLSRNIEYPESAVAKGIEGQVILKFTVEKNGSVNNIRILRNPGEGLGEEAKRVVRLMPAWRPGQQRGKNVRVDFVLPVRFKLPTTD